MLSHATETLIPGLDYAVGATAQFITQRQAPTVFPSGGDQYSVNGVWVLRFELQSGDDMFLDPSTLRLAFKLEKQKRRRSGASRRSASSRGSVCS